MAQHNLLGHSGEETAARYLMREGYTLHELNWRCGHLEIDIVAEWYGEIVFVEVKTRRDERFGAPEEAVGTAKQAHLVRAANAYLRIHRIDSPSRFDIIAIVGERPPFTIRHTKHAFDVPTRTVFGTT